MWYGAAYYPEHWPEDRWQTDARMMRSAGFNVVRIGEFAWCRMEPAPDRFEFEWLDRAIAALACEGISTMIGIPTAGPPAWLLDADSPEHDCRMLYEDGVRWESGGRSMTCVNHPGFVDRAGRITRALAERYAAHPNVMGFQVDNELGMYGTRCHCPHCVRGFREWLRSRHGDVAALNCHLGMVFGGAEFGTSEDVPIPRTRQGLHNPGLLLESQRFFSDSNVRFVRTLADELKSAGVRQPVTTNVCHMMSGWNGIDGADLFGPLDVAGWDCYPQQFARDPSHHTLGLLHSIARSYKSGRPYWMLEQQSGAPMEMPVDDPRRIRLWTWQSVAHGAGMILFFRWRTCPFGGEQHWRGIIGHDGGKSDRLEIVSQTGAEIARVAPPSDTVSHRRQAAILMDFDNCESLGLDRDAGAPRVAYRALAERWFEALSNAGMPPDTLFDTDQLDGYDMVVAPAMRLMGDDDASRMRSFVEGGGTLVAEIAFASFDRHHVVPDGPVARLMADVFGVRRIDTSPLGALGSPPKERLGEDASAWAGLGTDDVVPLLGSGPLAGRSSARSWIDHLRAEGAEVLVRFAEGTPGGPTPAVTVNHLGAGRAVYVASVLEQPLLDRLASHLCPPVAPEVAVTDRSTEVVPCHWGDRDVTYVLNHGHGPTTVRVQRRSNDLLTGVTVMGEQTLEPYDVLILTPEE